MGHGVKSPANLTYYEMKFIDEYLAYIQFLILIPRFKYFWSVGKESQKARATSDFLNKGRHVDRRF